MVDDFDRNRPRRRESLQPGDMIARRYEVLGFLGDGGAGRLVHVRSITGEALALRLTVAQGDHAMQSLKEAIALHARIAHRGLCRLRDCGEHAGYVWYAMDYLQGTSLELLVAKHGPLSFGDAARIIVDTAEVVQAVHDAGHVYLDLKQGTVFLEAGRHVRLLDFGVNVALARAARIPAAVLSTPSALASGHGGEAANDPRMDIYALGAVLFYALTGKCAFPAGRQVMQLTADLELEPPSLADVSKKFRPVLKQALAMRVRDRFQTLHDFTSALAKLGDADSGWGATN